MSKATPEAVQAVFHPDSLRDEVAYLNRLLDDSNLAISCLLQLLRDHNVPVGSTELIKAREKVEAEIQTLRTANAGLVEKGAAMSIPKDGYYRADVILGGRGLWPLFVHVRSGAIYDGAENKLPPEACSNFREVNTTLMVRVWPDYAAMELHALRTANAGFVEKVAELQSWKEQQLKVESEWNPNELAALLGGNLGESQRSVIQREVPKLVERVRRLEEAGDAHREWVPVSFQKEWEQAKGQP